MTKKQQLEDLNRAVAGQSGLATAILEDAAVRMDSEKRSDAYLKAKDEYTDGTPFWMWCLLWYILGMFTIMTIDASLTDALVKLSEWIQPLL
jgi:hypothetical protein